MKLKARIILVIICVSGYYSGKSQVTTASYPVAGKPIPEFRLSDVYYYSQKTFDPREVKGKWTILDFWNKYCTSCVESFPKINQLQNEFKEHVQFLLIGQKDKKYNKDIEKVFERYRKVLGLNLAVAYDSTLFSQFEIKSAPHVVIIDPQSRVYAVTFGSELTRENLWALVEGRKPVLNKKYYDFEAEPVASQWKYWLDENKVEQTDFFYRSILSANHGEIMMGSWAIDQYAAQGCYQIVAAHLSQLYKIAYFGEGEWGKRSFGGGNLYSTHWKYPVLEINDSSAFQFSYANGTGFYNYSLIVPREKATKSHLMEVMQDDLKNYFGYEVSVESRMMPYWKFTATDDARKKLKAKGKSYETELGPTGIEGNGITIETILDLTELYNSDERIPFIDETGIKDRIDINFNAAMTDMEDVTKALKKHGLILEKSKKEVKVLVIRDNDKSRPITP